MLARLLVALFAWILAAVPVAAQTARNLAVLNGPSSSAKLLADFSANTASYLGSRSSPTALPGWNFSGGTTSNGAVRYAENSAGQLVAFASGAPRITDKGLLIEEGRQNLLVWSQRFDDASWASKVGINVTPAAAAAPDGTTTAQAIAEDTTNGTHRVLQSGLALSSGQTYTAAYYVKAAGRTWVALNLAAGFGNERAYFNLSSGTVGSVSGGTASIYPLANGWWRVSLSSTATATSGAIWLELASANGTISYTGAGTVGAYFWQADVQPGAFVTSPIVTTTASATRAADNASVTGLGSILAAPVTLVAWGQLASADGTSRRLAQLADNTGDNTLDIRRGADNSISGVAITATVQQTVVRFTGPYTGALQLKGALRASGSSLGIAVTGLAPTTTSPISLPTSLNRITLGATSAGGNYLNGYVQRVGIYGDMSDAALSYSTIGPISWANFDARPANDSTPILWSLAA